MKIYLLESNNLFQPPVEKYGVTQLNKCMVVVYIKYTVNMPKLKTLKYYNP
jgi:hypothetical protein